MHFCSNCGASLTGSLSGRCYRCNSGGSNAGQVSLDLDGGIGVGIGGGLVLESDGDIGLQIAPGISIDI